MKKKMKNKRNALLVNIGLKTFVFLGLSFVVGKFILLGLDFITFEPSKPLTVEQLTRFVFILTGMDLVIISLILSFLLVAMLTEIFRNIVELNRLKKWWNGRSK